MRAYGNPDIAGGGRLEEIRSAGPAGRWRAFRTTPGPGLPEGLLAYNEFDLSARAPRRRLELPATWVSVVVILDGTLHLPGRALHSGGSLVIGPTIRSGTGWHGGTLAGVELLMQPWLAWQLFATPLADLAGHPAGLPDLLGRRGVRLTEQLGHARDPRERYAVVESFLARERSAGPTPAPQVRHAWQLLTAAAGCIRPAEVAAAIGWGVRNLEKRFAAEIGQSPKRFARTLRLHHAIDLLLSGATACQTANDCGFADQAHLSREVKAMTGVTPTRLLALSRGTASGVPSSALPPLHRMDGRRTSVLLDG